MSIIIAPGQYKKDVPAGAGKDRDFRPQVGFKTTNVKILCF